MEDAYALDDLLGEEALGLSLAIGGPNALRRRVSGVHPIEVEHPARWLAPDWVMLTTGVALRNRPDAQRDLIRELHAAHVAALGFGVGVVFKHIPPAIRAEAEALNYPVFEVPLKTPFREIIAHVNRSLVGGEIRTYQRISSMQHYLIDALTHDHPQRTLLERLAGFLDATVVVFDTDGTTKFATAEVPADEIWSGITERADALIAEFDAGDWHVVAAPVARAGTAHLGWLAVTASRSGFSNRLAKVAVQASAPLLSALARLEELSRDQERAVRASLLTDALTGEGAGDQRVLAARARALGFDLAKVAHVIVLKLRTGGGPRPRPTRETVKRADALDTLFAAVEDLFARERVPLLLAKRDDAVVGLVQRPGSALRDELSEIVAAQPGAIAGIGRAVSAVPDVRASFGDAQHAVARAQPHPGAQAVVDFADFDFETLIVSDVQERLQPKLDAYLAPVLEHGPLFETLAAYFAHDLNVNEAANALHMHPNTLRYRLARVESVIGQSLKHPATIAALHIALTANREASDS